MIQVSKNSFDYYKSCAWSPDGSCILANSTTTTQEVAQLYFFDHCWFESCNDGRIAREWNFAASVYDYCFYPLMRSDDASSCCFITCIKDSPVQLWDVITGKLRATYCAPDHVEVIRAPNSSSFNLDGSKIYCGYTNRINVFSTGNPGNQSDKISTTSSKRSKDGLKGIISSITFNPDYSGIFAAGTFSGEVGLYDERDYSLLDLKYVKTGVSQVEFTRDGKCMITASRKSNEILVWDLRNTGQVLYTLPRDGDTNQRLKFCLDGTGRYLGTGDTNGYFSVFDLSCSERDKKVMSQKLYNDVCSSVAFHPYLPFLASTSGERRSTCLDDDDSETGMAAEEVIGEISVWRMNEI